MINDISNLILGLMPAMLAVYVASWIFRSAAVMYRWCVDTHK